MTGIAKFDELGDSICARCLHGRSCMSSVRIISQKHYFMHRDVIRVSIPNLPSYVTVPSSISQTCEPIMASSWKKSVTSSSEVIAGRGALKFT